MTDSTSREPTKVENKSAGPVTADGLLLTCSAWNCDGWSTKKWLWLVNRWGTKRPDVVVLVETHTRGPKMSRVVEKDGYGLFCTVDEGNSSLGGVAVLLRVDSCKERFDEIEELALATDCEKRADASKEAKSAASGHLIGVRLSWLVGDSVRHHLVVVGDYTYNAGKKNKYLTYRVEHWEPAKRKILNALFDTYKNVAVLGDMNVAPADADCSHPATAGGRPCCTEGERKARALLLADGWKDAWRDKHGPNAVGFTHTDKDGYRKRLDHALVRFANGVVSVRDAEISRALDPSMSDHLEIQLHLSLSDCK